MAKDGDAERFAERVRLRAGGIVLRQPRGVAARGVVSVSRGRTRVSAAHLSSTARPLNASRHSASAARSGGCTSCAYGAVRVLSCAAARSERR